MMYLSRFKEHRKTMKHRKNDPEGTFKKVMKDVDMAVSIRDTMYSIMILGGGFVYKKNIKSHFWLYIPRILFYLNSLCF